ncbi:type II toxin-antitoxin system CcdA family antitoxin [Pseudooceanicola sp.]|uniref:type II toxin-antitoxin system CcdA family antitoxin n=1 Tax=Pseudooceanicola sp. TaxID=1914328 RepID=UPI0035C67CAA
MSTAAKQRTNVTLSADTLADARALGLNVSAISDAALAEAVRQAKAKDWAEENAEALAERRKWIAENGTILSDIQVFKVDG